MSGRTFLGDRRGSVSVEFVMILPMAFALLFPAMELGHFYWTQHKLAEAVRDGSRFAARLSPNRLCNGATAIVSGSDVTAIKLMTRTGQLASSTATAKVAGWDDGEVSVTVSCQAFVSTGIYSVMAAGDSGAIVTVAASNVPYPSLLMRLGLISTTVRMNAKSSAPVIGI